jgi:microsomal dipeptidase-like Zn-dependent dipeptidase
MTRGFADLHNHQFAHLGFGGLAFWGMPYGDPTSALAWCTPAHGLGGATDFIGMAIKAASGGGLALGHLVGGYPEFDGWPRWDSFTHQAVYEDWLYRAVQGGLRLMVMLAVNSEVISHTAKPRADYRAEDLKDMAAVDRQLAAAKAMEKYIDQKFGGPGRGWYRIVYGPEEAQRTIDSGKLAVVLGVEVDYLFNSYPDRGLDGAALRRALDHYHTQGVRHLFPIHFANNAFGGASFDKSLQFDDSLEPVRPTGASYPISTEDGREFGYQYRGGRRNRHGLTELGKSLILEMIARGMLIEVDHMSARSKADTFAICERANYPVVSGHTGFVDISLADKRHEGQLTAAELERIRALGGMVAVIPKQGGLDEITTWVGPGQTRIPHTSGNTSESVAQAYLYGVSKMQGGPIGFGTDFNGFAGRPKRG